MFEPVLFKNRRPGDSRPVSLNEYRESGGYEALIATVGKRTPAEVRKIVLESGLRGRGGAGFPTGRKWESVPQDGPGPRYVVPNTDEMEPGTFKDRILVNADPHLVLEGIILTAYAVGAEKGIFFIRPSYEGDAQLIETQLQAARDAGFIGRDILGSGFSFDLEVHRSAGRYICGEASAQLRAIEGRRPNPQKGGPHLTEKGLWGKPTVVNNVETLSCVPSILRNGPEWFRKLARTETGSGPKLYCVSGKVVRPDCYELPIGTPLREIIFAHAGGMLGGAPFKACMPGGASTSLITEKDLDVEMDFEPLKKIGHHLGTASIIVYDRNTCLVAAVLNLITFFARESCGWCTPCREGLPFIREILRAIEIGEGKEEHIPLLRQMASHMKYAYCALALGAAEPLLGLLDHFEDEVRAHISGKGCPFTDTGKIRRPAGWERGGAPIDAEGGACPI